MTGWKDRNGWLCGEAWTLDLPNSYLQTQQLDNKMRLPKLIISLGEGSLNFFTLASLAVLLSRPTATASPDPTASPMAAVASTPLLRFDLYHDAGK